MGGKRIVYGALLFYIRHHVSRALFARRKNNGRVRFSVYARIVRLPLPEHTFLIRTRTRCRHSDTIYRPPGIYGCFPLNKPLESVRI